jgi:hypothetical protein
MDVTADANRAPRNFARSLQTGRGTRPYYGDYFTV